MKKEGDKMHCPKCGALNENDAIFCKHCGLPLEENSFKEKINQESMDDNKSKKQEVNRTTGKTKKPKNKNKTKHKTKNNNKTKIKKSKPQKISNETKVKGMTFGQKILMFILFLLVFSLIGALALGAYYYYNSEKVTVPNLINMTYDEALTTLQTKDLKIKTQEQEVEDPTKDGIVLKQNKAPGKEVRKNSTVKVTIGVYEEKYVLENFLGKNIDVAINALESNNIKYEITYTETTEYEDGIIISLTPEPGVTLEENSKVILEVAKNEENIKTPSENESSSQDESSEKPLEENKEDSSLN